MTNINTTNSLVGQTQKLIPNDGTGTLSTDAASAKTQLKNLFTQSYFNNGQVSTNELNVEIKRLEDKIKNIESKITTLQNKIKENADKIDGKAEELTNILKKIDEENDKILVGQGDNLERAIFSAKKEIVTEGKPYDFATRVTYYLEIYGGGSPSRASIEALFGQFNEVQSNIKLLGDIGSLLNEAGTLESQMSAANATKSLLTQTLGNMSQAKGPLYTNSDTDTKIPIFSPAKETLVDGFLEKYTSRYTADMPAGGEAKPMTAADKNALVQDLTASAKADVKDLGSPAALNKAITGNNSMIQQLANAGFSGNEILETVVNTFGSATGLSKTANGFTAPNSSAIATSVLGAVNGLKVTKTDSAKTVAGNPQAAQMQTAINDGILNTMAKDGFSFKEAMYVMQKLFPNANIGYTLGQKSLTLPVGDDKNAQDMYSKFTSQVKTNWGVDAKQIGSPLGDGAGKVTTVTRTDPVGFSDGNSTYEFVLTEGQKFGGNNDFLGAEEDPIAYLKSLADDNGIVKGDALKELKMLRTDHKTGDYGFMSAADAGITSIDVNSFAKSSITDQKGGKHDFENINDAQKVGTFSIIRNGKAVEGYQKLETNDYMNTVYGQAKGLNVFSKLSEGSVTSTIDNAYSSVSTKFSGMKADLKKLQELKDLANDNTILERRATMEQRFNEKGSVENGTLAQAISEFYEEQNKVK